MFCAGLLASRIFGYDDSWLQHKRSEYAVGSWQWLALTEQMYGGFKIGVASGNNRGGDRMAPRYHGYGLTYAEFLQPLLSQRNDKLTLVEVGILNGSGLAIWCDLFPNARIVGLDISLDNFNANLETLEEAGAFSSNRPELHVIDQLKPAEFEQVAGELFASDSVNIIIDDGLHSVEAIANTFSVMEPYLAPQFVYFIEDNYDTYDVMARQPGGYKWAQRSEMVVVTRRK